MYRSYITIEIQCIRGLLQLKWFIIFFSRILKRHYAKTEPHLIQSKSYQIFLYCSVGSVIVASILFHLIYRF
jgi:hypothetical protein